MEAGTEAADARSEGWGGGRSGRLGGTGMGKGAARRRGGSLGTERARMRAGRCVGSRLFDSCACVVRLRPGLVLFNVVVVVVPR